MKNIHQEQYSIQENQPADWFEPLYAGSSANDEGVPWAIMETQPSFASWLTRNPADGEGQSTLVVGCCRGTLWR